MMEQADTTKTNTTTDVRTMISFILQSHFPTISEICPISKFLFKLEASESKFVHCRNFRRHNTRNIEFVDTFSSCRLCCEPSSGAKFEVNMIGTVSWKDTNSWES